MKHRRPRRNRDPQLEGRDPARGGQLEADIAALEAAMSPYSIELSSQARTRLLFFARELISWNNRLNLLSRPDVYNVIRKHVAASLGVLLVAQPAPRENWIDVGTGGGFPGLVLKLVRPELEITLLDSSRKRCLFLESVLRQTGVAKTPVLALRVETLVERGEGLGAFTVLTARAVASLRDTVRLFGPLVGPSGRIVTFKGPRWGEELADAERAGDLAAGGFQFESITRVPWTTGHILSLRRAPASASIPG